MPSPLAVGAARGRTSFQSIDPEAQAAWDLIVPPLERIGLLDGIDAMALEAMCVQYARAKQARRIIDEQGLLTTGSTGQIVEHPALAIERASIATS